MKFYHGLVLLTVVILFFGAAASAQEPAGNATESDSVAPAPASIGADVPLTYFGPAPSTFDPQLIGPNQLLRAGEIDLEAGTITMPLYEGRMEDGRTVWYILTDTDDKGNADALGLNWAPKLTYTDVGRGARSATLEENATLTFQNGTVDFAPGREVVPADAPSVFPPANATPGSVGDEEYSPLVRIENAGGAIYNAPMIAFDVAREDLNFTNSTPDYSIVHDKVVSIDPTVNNTVTIALTEGFSFAKPVLYLSTDASDPLAAALEGATYAPALGDIPVGGDDSAFSGVERIFVFINGPTGVDNPQRQGLNSALIDGRSPLNVFGGIPSVALDYSPLWDMNLGEWTNESIENGYRSRLTEEFEILGFVEDGWITGPGGAAYGSVGIIVNCPIAFRFL